MVAPSPSQNPEPASAPSPAAIEGNRAWRAPGWLLVFAHPAAAWIAFLAFTGKMALVANTSKHVWDDAFMFGRYALNWERGYGWTWNPGDPPMNGLTSPLWEAVSFALWCLSRPLDLAWAQVLAGASWMSFIAFWFFLFAGLRALLQRRWQWLAYLPLLYFLSSDRIQFAMHAVRGMETLGAAAIITLWAWAALQRWARDEEEIESNGVGVSALFVLPASVLGLAAYLLRPEAVLLIGGICLLKALPMMWAFIFRRGETSRASQEAFFTGFFLFLLLVIWHAAHYGWFGHLFPLPARLKGFYWRSPYLALYDEVPPNIAGVARYYIDTAWPLHLLTLTVLMWRGGWRTLYWYWIPLHATLLYTLSVFAVMGDACRYQLPFLGPLFLLIAASIAPAGKFYREGGGPCSINTSVPHLFACIVAFSLLTTVILIPAKRFGTLFEDWPPLKESVGSLPQFPPGTRIAATEVGALGLYLDHCIIYDLVGLHDVEFSQGFSAEALFEREVDVMTFVHDHYEPMICDIQAQPEWNDFEFLGCPLLSYKSEKDTYYGCVWLNRNSPFYYEIKAGLESE